ncbi:MAG: 1-deoxy-D-xylulose-5-phosphate synthase [Bacilli bacterium]
MELSKIKNPKFLKTLSIAELNALCSDIRQCIITTVSQKGGHLSSNLGVVELTVAIHRVFDAPNDKIIFDVGHQSYTHKILTGRYQEFVDTLRDLGGLSGYQKLDESKYDPYEAGHSSTSISAICGFLKAQEINGKTGEIIGIIGDSSLVSGLALEGLNNLANMPGKAIIVFNDNNMAISKPVGGLAKGFARIRNTVIYTSTKSRFKTALSKNKLGRFFYRIFRSIKNFIKRLFLDSNIFENVGLDYMGPIDGHNMKKLIKALEIAKKNPKTIVVHVVTTKGKGYQPAENDLVGKWHGVGEFDVVTGAFKSDKSVANITWSQGISAIVHGFMENDKKIVAITPAMIEGSKMQQIFSDFPNRSIDVGIAEEHAFTMAGAMSLGGAKPYICIYSTFLQRSYDEIVHDVARMNIPLVVGVDRAGIVGKDGSTHQGIFDVGMLRTIPNVVISMPKDINDARLLFKRAFEYDKLFFIRYPRESTPLLPVNAENQSLEIGQWDFYKAKKATLTLIVTGPNFNKVKEYVDSKNLPYNLVFARFYQPLDEKVLQAIIQEKRPLVIYDIYATKEGLFDAISEYLVLHNVDLAVKDYSLPTKFIKHGSINNVLDHLGLNLECVFKDMESKE